MTLILSYNVRWNSTKKQIDNILLNIKDIINKYDIDFLLFQEVVFYKKILNIIDSKKYDSHLHYSDKNVILTIFKKKYVVKEVFNEEFEKGRPFNIFYFYNKLTKNFFYLTNIHAGHNENTKKHLFNHIQDVVKNFSNKAVDFIIAGDFNANITKTINIKTQSKIFKLQNIIS